MTQCRKPVQRWPVRDGYRAVERLADVALMPADEVPDSPVEWLWPDTIPVGHLTLVAGEPGSGKSFWMTDLAARVSFARDWPYMRGRHEPDPLHGQETGHNEVEAGHNQIQNPKSKIQNHQNGSVVLVNSDDSFDDVQQPRLAAADAQLPLVGLMRRMPPGSRFSQFNSVGPVDHRLQALKAAIQEAGDCKLAIVDDLARFVRDGLGKVTRGDLMLALERLRCIAAECHVALIVVWRLERIGRATARYLETFLPAAAMAWLVGNDPYRPQQRWVVSLKNHFGPPPEPMAFHIADNRVVWDEPPSSVPADVMAAFVRKSDRRLADGPVEANELFADAEAFGFSRRTVRRALVDLGLKPKKLGNDGPWCWSVGSGGQHPEGTRGDREELASEVERTEDGLPRPSRPNNCNKTAWEGHPPDGAVPSAINQGSACGASGLPSGEPFEDGQLAHKNNIEDERGTTDGTGTVPATSEDGQLTREVVADVPADCAEYDEIHIGTSDEDKIVLLVLHPRSPARHSASKMANSAQQRAQGSGFRKQGAIGDESQRPVAAACLASRAAHGHGS